ncbi:MAG: hypothetical protein E6H81_02030 [Chloroflexi bacterium]|nr:MAG: hypothetical protein E6H81_02030 [Chloroflexota bacterium]
MSDRAGLGDLFREEFADVLHMAGHIGARRPTIPIGRTSIGWAILAGIGAGFFAAEIVRIAASLLLSSPRTTELRPPSGADLATIAATAFALAVAWRAAGWLAAEGYLAVMAVERLVGLPTLLRTCTDPNFASAPFFADRCTVGGQLLMLWPVALGGVLALALVRGSVRSSASTNGTLEAAGVVALVQALLSPLANLILFAEPLPARTNPDPATVAAFIVAQAAIAGIIAGVVLARRSRWPWRGFAAIAVVVLIGYLWFSMPSILRALGSPDLGGLTSIGLISFGAPLYMLAAAAIALVTTRASAWPASPSS